MQRGAYNNLVQNSHSELLTRHRKLINTHRLRESLNKSNNERSSSVLEGTNFILTKTKLMRISLRSNAHSQQSRHSQSNPQSLNRQYKRMMSQSIDKAKHLQKSKQQGQPQRGTRAATFISRIIDKAKKSYNRQSSMDEHLDDNWRESLILQSNHNHRFIPVSKAKKSSFFENTSKGRSSPKTMVQQPDSQLQTTLKNKRQLDDYLNYIMAGQHQHVTICQSLDGFRNINKKQSIYMINRKTLSAITHLIQLMTKVLASNKVDTELKYQLLKQYCHLYFTLGEKTHFQVVMSCSILQGYRLRLRQVFLMTRIFMLGMFSLCLESKLFASKLDKLSELRQFALSLEESYNIIQQVLSEVCQSSSGNIDMSFKIIRSMYTIEKCCDRMKQLSREFLTGQLLSSKASSDIEKYFLYLLQRCLTAKNFQERLLRIQISLSWKYLHIPPTPYLPAQVNVNQLTIVFDLEETLVHIDPQKDIILKRPGLDTFLQSFHGIFEMVLFTNTSKDLTDRIMDDIDPKKPILNTDSTNNI